MLVLLTDVVDHFHAAVDDHYDADQDQDHYDADQSCRMSRILRIYPCKKWLNVEKLGNFNGGKSLFKCFLRVNYLTFSNSDADANDYYDADDHYDADADNDHMMLIIIIMMLMIIMTHLLMIIMMQLLMGQWMTCDNLSSGARLLYSGLYFIVNYTIETTL